MLWGCTAELAAAEDGAFGKLTRADFPLREGLLVDELAATLLVQRRDQLGGQAVTVLLVVLLLTSEKKRGGGDKGERERDKKRENARCHAVSNNCPSSFSIIFCVCSGTLMRSSSESKNSSSSMLILPLVVMMR